MSANIFKTCYACAVCTAYFTIGPTYNQQDNGRSFQCENASTLHIVEVYITSYLANLFENATYSRVKTDLHAKTSFTERLTNCFDASIDLCALDCFSVCNTMLNRQSQASTGRSELVTVLSNLKDPFHLSA